jgi:hypothetical protein
MGRPSRRCGTAAGRAAVPADQGWDGRLARSLTPHVLEIGGADRRMFVPGRLPESAAVLGEVITAVEHFLDHQAWPQGNRPVSRR